MDAALTLVAIDSHPLAEGHMQTARRSLSTTPERVPACYADFCLSYGASEPQLPAFVSDLVAT
jgi:hypothetical protein